MTSHRPRKRPSALAALAALTATTLLMLTLPASGAAASTNGDSPTVKELLDRCGSADFCQFHLTGPVEHYTAQGDVAGRSANCTGRSQDLEVSWSASASTSNSIGVSLEVMVGPVSKIFMAGVKVFYNQEWTTSRTWSNKTRLSVPRHSLGTVTYNQPMQRATGDWELHFSDRFHGHYYWYVRGFQQVGPDTSAEAKGSLITQSTPMTAVDRANYCSSRG